MVFKKEGYDVDQELKMAVWILHSLHFFPSSSASINCNVKYLEGKKVIYFFGAVEFQCLSRKLIFIKYWCLIFPQCQEHKRMWNANEPKYAHII